MIVEVSKRQHFMDQTAPFKGGVLSLIARPQLNFN